MVAVTKPPSARKADAANGNVDRSVLPLSPKPTWIPNLIGLRCPSHLWVLPTSLSSSSMTSDLGRSTPSAARLPLQISTNWRLVVCVTTDFIRQRSAVRHVVP